MATTTTAPQLVPEAAPAPASAAQAKRGKRGFLILGGVVAAIVLAIGGFKIVTAGQETTDDAQVEADVVPLAARVSGPVVKVAVLDNATVHQGDVLLQIDPRPYEARVKQAEAELESARAQAVAADAQATVAEAGAKGGLSSAKALVSTSTSAVSGAQAQVAAARAALTRAEAQARKATLDLDRTQSLRQQNVVAQSALDDAQTANETAQAALEGARAQLALAEEGRRTAESKVAEARGQLDVSAPIDEKIAAAQASASLAHARVKGAEAALDQAKLQLEDTRVVAPADGQVSKLSVHAGQLLTPGQAVAELVPTTTYVVANFKETQVGHMQPGQRVEVELDAFSGEKLEGKVESLSGGTGSRFSLLPPDNASGNFVKVVQRVPVRISWVHPPQGLALRAGLSADVTVHTK
ncbi:HlyD family secretion protein [Corallococcus exiguus]|uniref:HlyD family efflux transporter periplasmic adaptor subunit n=1 Tax=Corallococcus exiguus TaxID=83462 RepID=A0A7X4YH14_9BACT|nr:HlyD family secretion protein [Corallococcus exiguus]NBC45234.1 HlyD family efflux transporter periplasmic adaptor subunit [Corallococcus exiguus]TNV64450.1 HlyD family secretion protein [Corallococcus exiguus]